MQTHYLKERPKKTLKRILALTLAVLLLTSVLPFGIVAQARAPIDIDLTDIIDAGSDVTNADYTYVNATGIFTLLTDDEPFVITSTDTVTITQELTFIFDEDAIINWDADIDGDIDDEPLVTFKGTTGTVNIANASIENEGNGGAITSQVDININADVVIDGAISLEGANTMTINEDFENSVYLTVGVSSELTVDTGIKFTNEGEIHNHGIITNAGTIVNNGTINSTSATFTNDAGRVDNYGTITGTVTGGTLNHAVTYGLVPTTSGGSVAITVGGTAVSPGVALAADGTNVTLTATPTDANWRVKAWTVNAASVDGTTATTLALNNITAPRAVTVEFERIPRTISFNANGGTGNMDAVSIGSGLTYNIKANTFTRENHTFIGWSTTSGPQTVVYADEATTSAVTADITLYAQWDAKTVSIGSQTGTLTALTASSTPHATFTVTTANIGDGQSVASYSWYEEVAGTTLTTAPIGIIPSATNVSSNSVIVTMEAQNTAAAGTFYFKVTIDGVVSDVGTLIVAQKAQETLAITAIGKTLKFGEDTEYQLHVTGGSNAGAVTFARTSGTVADVDVNTGLVTINGAGSINVTATMAGNTNYLPVTSAAITITIEPGEQAPLTITGANTMQYGTTLQLGYTGGSYGTVTFETVPTTDAGSVTTGGEVSTTDLGTITVIAKRDGGTNFEEVTSANHIITVTERVITGDVTISVSHAGSDPDNIDEGDELTAVVTGIYPADAQNHLEFQWYKDGNEISGQTSNTLTVGDTTDFPAGTEISVEVTGIDNYIGTIASTPVAVGKKPLTGSISIDSTDGTGVGHTLELDTSALLPDTAEFEIVWRRDGQIIPGATSDTYVITLADTGKDINVSITATGDYTGSMSSTPPLSIPAIAPLINSASSAIATIGVQRAFQVTITPDTGTSPITYSLTGGVPSVGVDIDPASGLITILATTPRGTHTFNVVATNSAGSDTQSFTLTVTSYDVNVATVTTPAGADLNHSTGTITATVSNSTTSQVIAVTVSPYAQGWALFSDFACTNLISGNTIPLNVGPNTVYLRVTADNGDTRIYIVTITRAPAPDPDDPDDPDDYIIDEPGTIENTDDDAIIHVDLELEDLQEVRKNNAVLTLVPCDEVDGRLLIIGWVGFDGPIGHIDSGSTIITIYKEFLETLPNGIYVFDMDFDDGEGNIITVTVIYEIDIEGNTNAAILPPSWKPAKAENGFRDVPNGSWMNPAVSWAELNGITKGSGVGTFKPNDYTTRAEFVTFLHRVYGTPTGTAPAFGDMPFNTDFRNAILWARAEGVTTGVGNNMFAPNDNITREQVAVMLYRQIGGEVPVTPNALTSYTDRNAVSPWATDAVNWAVANGIMGVGTGNRLNPGDSATRAEAITMIYRAVIAFGVEAPE
ncbi:MAG: S-layer homology domain-containing protein [Oscillospiraceae bacterium]|nr:S-layer homology domain-containing protein [Oscillospiraceae bacterium]